MAESDPYEEWKAQGRPMGSFAAWMASQSPAPAPAAPGPAPAPAPSGGGGGGGGGGSSPFSDPVATQEYNRLVAAGENPTTAANIVRNALFGVEHDWQAQGGDQGKLWVESGGKYGALELSPEQAVNQYRAWEKDRMPGCPPDFPYRGREGQCAEKPDDCPDGMHVVGTPGKCVPNGPGEEGLPKGPNDKGGKAGPPPAPPKPVTFGNQLTMTGNPLQDMLIQQFNTGQNPQNYMSNIFALGEDMRVGGSGANADAEKSDRQAQSLSGGGLWWGQNKDVFGGFDASQKNAEGAATPSPAAPKPAAPAAPAAPATGGPTMLAPGGKIGGMHDVSPARKKKLGQPAWTTQPVQPRSPLSGMITNVYNSAARTRPTYF